MQNTRLFRRYTTARQRTRIPQGARYQPRKRKIRASYVVCAAPRRCASACVHGQTASGCYFFVEPSETPRGARSSCKFHLNTLSASAPRGPGGRTRQRSRADRRDDFGTRRGIITRPTNYLRRLARRITGQVILFSAPSSSPTPPPLPSPERDPSTAPGTRAASGCWVQILGNLWSRLRRGSTILDMGLNFDLWEVLSQACTRFQYLRRLKLSSGSVVSNNAAAIWSVR